MQFGKGHAQNSGVKKSHIMSSFVVLGHELAPTPASNVASTAASWVRQTCAVTQTLKQDATCSVLAKGCPGLTVRCDNSASQEFDCQLDAATNVVSDILSSEDPAAVAEALGLPTTEDPVTIAQKVTQSISQSCYGDDNVNQEIKKTLICNASRNVSFTVANYSTQATACSLGFVSDVVTRARQIVANKYNAAVQKTQTIQMAILVAMLAFAFVAVVLAFRG